MLGTKPDYSKLNALNCATVNGITQHHFNDSDLPITHKSYIYIMDQRKRNQNKPQQTRSLLQI